MTTAVEEEKKVKTENGASACSTEWGLTRGDVYEHRALSNGKERTGIFRRISYSRRIVLPRFFGVALSDRNTCTSYESFDSRCLLEVTDLKK